MHPFQFRQPYHVNDFQMEGLSHYFLSIWSLDLHYRKRKLHVFGGMDCSKHNISLLLGGRNLEYIRSLGRGRIRVMRDVAHCSLYEHRVSGDPLCSKVMSGHRHTTLPWGDLHECHRAMIVSASAYAGWGHELSGWWPKGILKVSFCSCVPGVTLSIWVSPKHSWSQGRMWKLTSDISN